MVEHCGILCETTLNFILWMADFRDTDLSKMERVFQGRDSGAYEDKCLEAVL